MPDPLAALGLQTQDPAPPALSGLAELAIACWNFCDGWAPERWPVFGALHDVPDWHALVELMQALREATRQDHGRQKSQVPAHR